jgi:PKD repeat protein
MSWACGPRGVGVAARIVAAIVLSALSLAPLSARADSYGELGHFGSAGTGHGQFRLTGPSINGTNGTRAFGVDATEDAVYVGDEPKAKEYRIQKLTSTGAFEAATAGFKPPNRQGIEGIAFDPALKRLYVLALERRGVLEHDPGVADAGTLYAFSTEAAGEVLPPASGTVEGVLTGPTTFNSQSDVPGDALLKPKGIAVDPTSHEVIVMGELDEGNEVASFALQRINASTGALGARYVDRSGLLTPASEPNSPVVSPDGAVYIEQIDAEGIAQLVRVPSDFTSAQPPTPFINFVPLGSLESETNAVVEFANGSGGESVEGGGGLSLSPEAGGNATIYADARVFESITEVEGAYYTGVLAFRDVGDSEGFELGWTAGQSRQVTEECAIGTGGPTAPMVAGGAGEKVFVLDSKFAHVVELGPGGSGCPTAEAGEILATTNGTPLSGTIPGGTEVTLVTHLTRANALSVEWSFDEGEAKPLVVATDEYQNTRITHRFEKGGELTVTETIHTDNLATPTISRTIKIPVSVSHLPPNAVIVGPRTIGVGQAATFDGSASWDPNGAPGSSPLESYRWDFGDGTSAVGESPEVEHTYTETGLYVAKLVVVNGYGLESQPTEIDVTVDVPPPPPETSPGASGAPTGPPAPLLPVEQPSASPPSVPPSVSSPPVPDVRLTRTSLVVGANGSVVVILSCPRGESRCSGTVAMRGGQPANAVSKGGSRRRSKTTVITLAKGEFAIPGGQSRSIVLRLSAAARTLLARSGAMPARATIVARDAAGNSHTARSIVTLRLTHARKAGGR